jgi:nitroimidazol reductase NimA-like FMN-containing flavoprotein (pyridoxamine 5'-phosphate oxidase superfamily)
MSSPPSDRTEVRRLAERGVYDADVINTILDEALVCHVGLVIDGSPVVIPMLHARDGDTLYLHGSPASRTLRAMKGDVEACVTVTLLDGIALARAPFHSSVNYRSVVIFGRPHIVDDPEKKRRAFRVLTEHVTPGRWDDSRQPTAKEEKGTLVAAMSIAEASAKVRTGPPKDDAEDYELPIWAGVIPLQLRAGEPIDDPELRENVDLPDYLDGYQRPGSL